MSPTRTFYLNGCFTIINAQEKRERVKSSTPRVTKVAPPASLSPLVMKGDLLPNLWYQENLTKLFHEIFRIDCELEANHLTFNWGRFDRTLPDIQLL